MVDLALIEDIISTCDPEEIEKILTQQMYVSAIFDSLSDKKYSNMRLLLQENFQNYHSCEIEGRLILDRLIASDKRVCEISGSQEQIRQHNTLVMKYIGNRTSRRIGSIQNVHARTAYRDINHALDRMMVLMLGIDGIRPSARRNETKAAAEPTSSRREITQDKP